MRKFLLDLSDGRKFEFDAELIVKPFSSRLFSSFKIALPIMAVGLLTILIPVAHFVTVPSLLLFGIIFGWKEFNKSVQINGATLSCLNCNFPMKSDELYFKELPADIRCDKCSAIMRIQLDS